MKRWIDSKLAEWGFGAIGFALALVWFVGGVVFIGYLLRVGWNLAN